MFAITPETNLRRLALHESAHALVALYHRLPIEFMSVRPEDIGDDAVAGVVQYGRVDYDYRLADTFAAGIATDGLHPWTEHDLKWVQMSSRHPVEVHVERAVEILRPMGMQWTKLSDAILREGRLSGDEVVGIVGSFA